MSQSIDNTAQALFPATFPRTMNVKFFLGNARRITAVQLAEQLDSADEQVRRGTATLVADVDNYCRA